jgi:hypothetical protein
LQIADVRQQVTLSLITEFENYTTFTPGDCNLPAFVTLLELVIALSTALAPLRAAPSEAAACAGAGCPA